MDNNIYIDLLLAEVPRILGQIDKNPLSSTYGCFDRNYWKYMVRDYANARFQEASYTLALLYSYKSKNNIYYNDSKIYDLAVAGILYWIKLQNRNGSFNEYYTSLTEICK